MEDDQNTNLETARADRSVWLMKCPLVVAKSWQAIPPDSQQNLSKVVVSLDPLHPEDPSSLQFSMEMAGGEVANVPKSYSLNMFKDFVSMCIFSEANQGKVATEGKVEHKFDTNPFVAAFLSILPSSVTSSQTLAAILVLLLRRRPPQPTSLAFRRVKSYPGPA